MPKLKLVTFDLDDTLWDIEPTIIAASQKTKNWLASRLPNIDQWYELDKMDLYRKALLLQKPKLEYDLGELRRLVLEEAMRSQGIDADSARSLSFGALDVFLSGRHEVVYFEGTLETLETLSQHFILGALTNGNTDIARLGLDRFFSFSHTSASVGIGKPHAEIFQCGLASAGVKANEALHVGDHPEHDITGAAGVGIYTLHFNLLSRFGKISEAAPPDLVASNMQEVKEKILAFSEKLSAN